MASETAVMSAPVLKQLLARHADARTLVARMVEALGAALAIEDADGGLLHGEPPAGAFTRHPVAIDGTRLGWVSGPQQAAAIAAVLEHLVSREAERKALAGEVLHLYREVNFIYNFSERLAALLDLQGVATLTLQQARQLIVATDGAIMLLDEAGATLSTLAGFGDALPPVASVGIAEGVVGAIAATGIADIVNDLDSEAGGGGVAGLRSIACAPLRVGERVIGVIALGCTEAITYTAGELKLLTTLGLQAATAIENARLFERTVEAAAERERLLALHQAAELARARLENELDLAARIQADLFPSELPRFPGYDLAARNRPARRCGGDYYDALTLPGPGGEPRLLLCVADVSGKGLPASLVMSNMQATLRALLGRSRSLVELATESSRLLHAATPEKYVTAALLELTLSDGAVQFVGAGHVPGLMMSARGDVRWLESTGTPLGLFPDLSYEQTSLQLAPGDCVVLYSDGVTEARNEDGDEFGEDRLLEAVRDAGSEPAEVLVSRIIDALDRFVGFAPQFDDITLLVLRKERA